MTVAKKEDSIIFQAARDSQIDFRDIAFKRMRILVVDDDIPTRTLIEMYLDQWGYEYESAPNGIDALRMFQDHKFDIVISDWMMPGMSGPDLCKHIRDLEQEGHTYIILCTVMKLTENIVEGIESGADDYITKPFDQAELKVRLQAGRRLIRLQHSLEATNNRLKRGLEQAAAALTSMLPARRKGPLLNLDWLFRPSAFIGGDLFNVYALDEKRISLYIIDVSGHGVASALFAVSLGNILRPSKVSSDATTIRSTFGAEDLGNPQQVAFALNERFPLKPPTNMYFTLFYAVINQEDLTMRWIRAGHPPPILINKKGNYLLSEGDPPIGFFPGTEYTEYVTQLEHGDRLYLYSDGITEAKGRNPSLFGSDQLLSNLVHGHHEPLGDVIHRVSEAVLAHQGNNLFTDDLSMLAIEII